MQYIIDFHLHSKYSRSTSKAITLENLDVAAEQKGIDILTTADFTHPAWFKEIETKLERQENGFYVLKRESSTTSSSFQKKKATQFILTTELSCVYKKNDQCRRIHLVIICSDVKYVKKVNQYLAKKGFNLKSDGRPILGIDVKDLAAIYLEHDPQALIIPAHIWTPWYAMFGSKSGFNSIKECFDDLADEIPAIETGLSSDPWMNWHISELNAKMILSNSDAHSLDKLGREANVFSFDEISYEKLYQAVKENRNLDYTIEFYPEEGKYHYDGHRACGLRLSPEETKKHQGICPKCGKKIVVGVLNRVMELADQKPDPKNRVPFKSLVPLKEIISEVLDLGVGTKGVQTEYNVLMEQASEFAVLLHEDVEGLQTLPKIKEGIQRVRDGKLIIEPGYDGEYGKVKVFSDEEVGTQQKKLF